MRANIKRGKEIFNRLRGEGERIRGASLCVCARDWLWWSSPPCSLCAMSNGGVEREITFSKRVTMGDRLIIPCPSKIMCLYGEKKKNLPCKEEEEERKK